MAVYAVGPLDRLENLGPFGKLAPARVDARLGDSGVQVVPDRLDELRLAGGACEDVQVRWEPIKV